MQLWDDAGTGAGFTLAGDQQKWFLEIEAETDFDQTPGTVAVTRTGLAFEIDDGARQANPAAGVTSDSDTFACTATAQSLTTAATPTGAPGTATWLPFLALTDTQIGTLTIGESLTCTRMSGGTTPAESYTHLLRAIPPTSAASTSGISSLPHITSPLVTAGAFPNITSAPLTVAWSLAAGYNMIFTGYVAVEWIVTPVGGGGPRYDDVYLQGFVLGQSSALVPDTFLNAGDTITGVNCIAMRATAPLGNTVVTKLHTAASCGL